MLKAQPIPSHTYCDIREATFFGCLATTLVPPVAVLMTEVDLAVQEEVVGVIIVGGVIVGIIVGADGVVVVGRTGRYGVGLFEADGGR